MTETITRVPTELITPNVRIGDRIPARRFERGRPARRAFSRVDVIFESLCRGRDRAFMVGLVGVWIVCLVNFWVWWLAPSHQVSATRTAIVAFVLIYITVLLPALPVLYLLRLRRVNAATPLPKLRVAIVVTKAPSEPWDLLEKTLRAMLEQSYASPYDTWLCDENPSDVTREWCVSNGVRLSTRYGVTEYHRPTWPRRTRCKEGNLAYFYDNWGYEAYDVVVQLDADHVPSPDYLASMVRPFNSWRVGYVAAPSICDTNSAESWAARGRLYKEAALHGPSQTGCNDGFAPVCIGSHYAVRTSALRQIGGLGPELAEDFTTSFLLSSAGWEGAFALDAEAHGEGPATFTALAVQEFQWSQSLTVVALRMYLKHFRRLPWRLRLRFGMALLYYPMLVVTTIAGISMGPIAVVTGEPWMNVNYFEFLARWLVLSVPLLTATAFLRHRRVLRPVDAKILTWEVWLFSLARWPYVALGFVSGLKERITSRPRTIKVTPKGERGLEVLSVRFLIPYLVVSSLTIGVVWFRSGNPAIRYYVVLCLLAAAIYLAVALSIAVLHAVETRRTTGATWFEAVGTIRTVLLALLGLSGVWAFTAVTVIPKVLSFVPPPGFPPR
jgi:cellulose synthase (UDP-forming)